MLPPLFDDVLGLNRAEPWIASGRISMRVDQGIAVPDALVDVVHRGFQAESAWCNSVRSDDQGEQRRTEENSVASASMSATSRVLMS